MATAVVKGRCVPLGWASVEGGKFDKSRNSFEESLLLVLRQMIGPELKVIILADRGLGRTELARFCQRHGFGYIIRISPDVWINGHGDHRKLQDYPVRKGIARLLKNVRYRSHHPVQQNIVIRWKPNLPKKRDECWFLMTDQRATPTRLSQLYGRRMAVEQLFRDGKNKRNGWSLRDTQMTRADRLDRLILILALVYLLLCGIGLAALKLHRPGDWCSNSHPGTCSVFQIGRQMPAQLKCSPRQAFATFLTATDQPLPKRG